MTDKLDRQSLRNYIKSVKKTGEVKGLIIFTFFDEGLYLYAQCNILQAKSAVMEMVDKIGFTEDGPTTNSIN